MKVKEVMTKKVITGSPNLSFSEIIKILIKNNISGFPIVDKKGKVIGVLSEKDIFYKLFPSEKKFYKDIEYYTNYKNIEKEVPRITKLKAKDFMSKTIVSVSSEDHVLTACSLLLIHEVRRLPVIDNGKLVGIVTTHDLYRNFLKSLIRKR